ncbi:DUF922 domain-containing protein [Salmonirosea aquatica]|uniref:DUF922 domain-containing protein n=1 Tax=Salmonirosea aquatica TaxID=2654236 RepID=A0A7C9BKS4_9BACT|nr:hypothetical protein [Cytophagaceae bacterium SJW1-29]
MIIPKNPLKGTYLAVMASIWCWVLALTPGLGQPASSGLIFKKEKIALANARSFYILDVADKRKMKPNQLGTVVLYGTAVPLLLNQPLERELFEHWSSSLRPKTEESLPLEIQLDEVSVSERKIAPNKISGEMKVKITFQWTRAATTVFLTGYSTASTYTRPETSYDHEAALRRLLDGAIRNFDQWIGLNENKNPLLARGVKLVFENLNQGEQSDTVFYDPARKLTWDDFQGNSNRPGSKYAAAVFSSLSYEGSSKMAGKYLQATIGLKVFMVKSMSWGRSEARNSSTLAHEQTHFNITRLMAERFRERLKTMDLTIEDYDSQIQYEFLEIFREMNKEQEKYDAESHHGLNTSVQDEWNRKVQAEITRLYQGS